MGEHLTIGPPVHSDTVAAANARGNLAAMVLERLTKALETVATGSDLRQRFVDRALQAEAERDRRSDELRRAQGVIGRVRALHAQHDGRCTECVEHCDCLDRVKELGDDVEVAAALRMCPHGNKVWPCPTSDALETPSPP